MPNEKEPVARRKSPATGRARVSGLSSAAQVRAQQEVAVGLDLRGILSKMTAADKVGQLLMCYLDPETLEETISRYRCGTHAALGEPWLIFYSYENMILGNQRLATTKKSLSLHFSIRFFISPYCNASRTMGGAATPTA